MSLNADRARGVRARRGATLFVDVAPSTDDLPFTLEICTEYAQPKQTNWPSPQNLPPDVLGKGMASLPFGIFILVPGVAIASFSF